METNKIGTPNNWINNKNPPFNYQTNIKPNRIYFLYAFLGDGFKIDKEEYLNNLRRWKKTHGAKVNGGGNGNGNSWIISILRRGYDQLDNLVKEQFNWFYLTYKQYPKNIQRCDVIRYMLMYQYGGVYSDLDVTPNSNIDYVLNKYPWANVIFGVGREKPIDKCKHTTQIESIRKGEPEIPIRIANYFFISRIPYHPIWIDILKLAKRRSTAKITSQYGIIYTTGPDVVTTSISNNRNKYSDIAIIPHDEFTTLFPHSCSSFTDGSWRRKTGLPIGENGNNTV